MVNVLESTLGSQRGEGHTRLRVRGWGSPNSNDKRKSLALCKLCGTKVIVISEYLSSIGSATIPSLILNGESKPNW
jgi:hypothetical protein